MRCYHIFGLCVAMALFCSGCITAQPRAIQNDRSSDATSRKLTVGENDADPIVRAQYVADHSPNTAYGAWVSDELSDGDTFRAFSHPGIFAEYDERLVDSITDHWYQSLSSRQISRMNSGFVIIQFNLYGDGQITERKILRDTTGNLPAWICVKAITEGAPYERWTPEMIKAEPKGYRTITFTFRYKP